MSLQASSSFFFSLRRHSEQREASVTADDPAWSVGREEVRERGGVDWAVDGMDSARMYSHSCKPLREAWVGLLLPQMEQSSRSKAAMSSDVLASCDPAGSSAMAPWRPMAPRRPPYRVRPRATIQTSRRKQHLSIWFKAFSTSIVNRQQSSAAEWSLSHVRMK